MEKGGGSRRSFEGARSPYTLQGALTKKEYDRMNKNNSTGTNREDPISEKTISTNTVGKDISVGGESSGWREEEWREQAVCRGMGPGIFFGEKLDSRKTDNPALKIAKKAEDICNTCFVQAECLCFAMENHIEHGTWGGTNSSARRRLLRRLNNNGFRLYQSN